MKQVRITEHARTRMYSRKIDESILFSVLEHPEQIIPDDDDNNREVYQTVILDHNMREKLLRIVVEETITELVVVSVYATSQIKKYRKLDL